MTLRDRLKAGLEAPGSAPLLAGDLPGLSGADSIAAAVLIAITEREEPGVLLTVRRADMRTHAGQVAFPGGRVDPGETAEQAALREAWEELGLPAQTVQLAGRIETYCTVTRYAVVPIVGIVPPDLPLEPHEHEVADWFEAPLAHLLDPSNHVRRSALFQGTRRHYYEIAWQDRKIWGATAAILVNLSRRLR